MTKCPACGNWSLDFDEYFGRYRCFRAACGWMPSSMAERCIEIGRSGRRPRPIGSICFDERHFHCSYDRVNDVLILETRALDAPFIEVPDPLGTLAWRVSQSDFTVAGCDIVGVRRFGVPKALILGIPARIAAVQELLREEMSIRHGASALRACLAKRDVDVEVTGEWLSFREAWGGIHSTASWSALS